MSYGALHEALLSAAGQTNLTFNEALIAAANAVVGNRTRTANGAAIALAQSYSGSTMGASSALHWLMEHHSSIDTAANDLLSGKTDGFAAVFTATRNKQVLVRASSVDTYSNANTFFGITGSYSSRGLSLTAATIFSKAISSLATLGTAYTLFLDFETTTISETGTETLLSLTADSTHAVRYRKTTGPVLDTLVGNAGTQFNATSQTIWENRRYIMAMRVKANSFAWSINGGPVDTDTSGTLPTPTTMYVGSLDGATSIVASNYHVRRIAILPGTDADAALITLSTIPVAIRAYEQSDITALRSSVIAELWSGAGLPTAGATSVSTSVADTLPVAASNLLRVDELTIQMLNNAGTLTDTQIVDVWRPTVISSNNKLVVLVSGHTPAPDAWAAGNQGSMIKELVEAGYTVAGMDMAFRGADSAGTVTNHDALTNPDFSVITENNALKYFAGGTIRTINQLITEGFTRVFMTGLSGGGWTSALVPAIDTRIKAAASVAGYLPLYMVNGGSGGHRDWEQYLPGMTLDYQDLNVMSTDGARHFKQILNSADPSVFPKTIHDAYPQYATMVSAAAAALGGTFTQYFSTTSNHEFTADTRAAIIAFFNAI